ncbi:MFS transporter [Psychrosphaera sp. B3R10]|uniref:MFS transporter n=1 Tax=unclassified Psychrosphaera TaxID=2641570 RepID=UPI001C08CF47|nr:MULTISPECIES: MFS transporter [unclassified Psychrosphaera]MBU2881594.1 MFS transporter [Psychrosphaera sp. I2R16]MBU2991151.1 MFS transporter [Psychrosphaera sp. B3R10]MDO6719518.1 MFS transporter [Psychrosphaera sp. 1_MG-2023]
MDNIKLSSLVPAAAVNFFYYGFLGGVISYLAVFLSSRGFTSTEVGTLIASYTFIRIFSGQLWAYLADLQQNPKRYFQLAVIISFVALLPAVFIDIKWVTNISMICAFVFFMAAVSQIEVLSLVATKSNPTIYNRVRLFGSIGFIVAAIAVGTIVDIYGPGVILYVGLGLIFLTYLTSLYLDNGDPLAHDELGDSEGFFKRCCTVGFGSFLIASILLQMSFAPYVGFFTQYLSQHEYPGTATGILFALGTFAEIFMFLIAGHLLARYSLKLLMVVCLMLTALRWLLMAYYIDFVIVVILTQIIHAVSFGLMHSSSIHFVRRYFPKRMQNQGQFMYLGITFGIGGALGAWVTGMTWNEGLGGSDTFVWASMVVLVAGLVILMTPRKKFQFEPDKVQV